MEGNKKAAQAVKVLRTRQQFFNDKAEEYATAGLYAVADAGHTKAEAMGYAIEIVKDAFGLKD